MLSDWEGIRREGILLAKGVRSSLWKRYRKRPLDPSGNPEGALYTPYGPTMAGPQASGREGGRLDLVGEDVNTYLSWT